MKAEVVSMEKELKQKSKQKEVKAKAELDSIAAEIQKLTTQNEDLKR